jgi:hypothetical protein
MLLELNRRRPSGGAVEPRGAASPPRELALKHRQGPGYLSDGFRAVRLTQRVVRSVRSFFGEGLNVESPRLCHWARQATPAIVMPAL